MILPSWCQVSGSDKRSCNVGYSALTRKAILLFSIHSASNDRLLVLVLFRVFNILGAAHHSTDTRDCRERRIVYNEIIYRSNFINVAGQYNERNFEVMWLLLS